MTVNAPAARSLPQEQPGWRSCQSSPQFQARKGQAWASPRNCLPILNYLGSCKMKEEGEQSRHKDRHTDMFVKTHARTHTLHSQTSTQKHAHTHRCVHAHRPGGGTERLHKHQDAQRNRKKQRKRKEERARRSLCNPALELRATHPDLSPLLTSPSMAPWGN